jgi:gamma-glutamylcyclotransferase
MSFLYFAYGSNMLTSRLQGRCPSAVAVGVGIAQGRRIEFSKTSIDKSGKATLAVADDEGRAVPGVIFRIIDEELDALDKAEGAKNGYDRIANFKVCAITDGEIFDTITYLATEPDSALTPFDWYLALIIAGAQQHALNEEHLEMIRQSDFISDVCDDRKSRVEALKALKDSGHLDWKSLLKPK